VSSFITDFQKLLLEQPRYNVKQVNSENCEYADTAIKSKNCYYCFCVFYCENVYYSRYSRKCANSTDLTFCVDCRWCITCNDCVNCYMTSYSKNCSNCADCDYCTDCYSCENCYGCQGLYRKRYCLFNEQFSKEEYEERITKVTPDQIPKMDMPILGIHHFKTEECIGDNLSESKGCYQCYDAFNMEDCIYNIECNGNKDCLDMTVCFEAELCYSCVQAPINYNCNFLMHTDLCNDSEFCAYSKSLKNCFGCVYLSNKEYCILNKQYSPEEYEEKVAGIKKELKEAGFYNMSLYFVSDYEKERWAKEEDSTIQSNLIINNNDIMNTLKCRCCQKDFKVIKQEQRIYENKNLPLPVYCPECRHRQRMALRNERKLYKRNCDKCDESMLSTFPEDAPYKVYCQKCFWGNIG